MLETTPDIAGLVARCLNGDDAAKAELVNAITEPIRRCVGITLVGMSVQAPVRQDVEDIANDILVRLLSNNCAMLAQLRDRPRLGAWLTVLSRNHTVDHVRRWSSRMQAEGFMVREDMPVYGVSPVDALVAQEITDQVQGLLAGLSAREKLALDLYYLHGMKYAEIAAITGQNINTIATQIRRAREHLREVCATASPGKGSSHAPSK